MTPLLSIRDLRFHFHTHKGVARAVDGVSYDVHAGEALGVVGESGSGKSVTCMAALGLLRIPPGRVESGSALFDGRELLNAPPDLLRAIRGREIAMVFQDPMTALNPTMTIGAQIMEPLRIHVHLSGAEAHARAVAALREVGISEPESRMESYPHHFSGGMRQRVMLAMAIVTNPRLLIADEPTTALDVTVQAQVLNLMDRLRRDRNMALVLITHDLGVVANTCDRVVVMYAGNVMETAPADALFARPAHPYTRALLKARPSLQIRGKELYTIPGAPPNPYRKPEGCPFAPRCELAEARCHVTPPAPRVIADGHETSCWKG